MDRLPNMYPFKNPTITVGGSISGAGDNHVLQQPTKRRGRPKGSKNKPKTVPQPLVNNSLTPMVVTIDVPAGADVVGWLFQLCCRDQVSLAVLSGSGCLSEVILRGQWSFVPGPFWIKSISGTVTPLPQPSSGYMNSLESRSPLNVILLAGPDSQLQGHMIGGRAAAINPVKVMAMRTELKKVKVESVTDNNQAINNTNVQISPFRNNLPSHIMNVQFGESYKSATSHHMNNPVQIDNSREIGTHQEYNLMNSRNDKLMAVVMGATSGCRMVGRERVMMAAAEAGRSTTEMVMINNTSGLNNNVEIGPLSNNTPSFHNQNRTETEIDQEDDLMMNSSYDELAAIVMSARCGRKRMKTAAESPTEMVMMSNRTWSSEINKNEDIQPLISNTQSIHCQKEKEIDQEDNLRMMMMNNTTSSSELNKNAHIEPLISNTLSIHDQKETDQEDNLMMMMNNTTSSELNKNADIEPLISNTQSIHDQKEKETDQENNLMTMMKNFDDVELDDDFWNFLCDPTSDLSSFNGV